MKTKMFEDEITELQADMVEICNEYSCGVADKIFIIASCEESLDTDCFYVIKDAIFERHKINTSKADAGFDVSARRQKQVLNALKENVEKIKSVYDKYDKPMFTEMRLTYEAKTKKFNAEYKYDPQLADGKELPDIVNAWFEEEKSKLDNRSWGFILAVFVLILFALVLLVGKTIKSLALRLKSKFRRKKKIFEDEFSDLQTDMVDICSEYSCDSADKIFIYAANEGMILAQHFYCINNKILTPSKLNDAGLKIEFDVSDECQEQVLDILNENIQKIQALCEKHNKPVPTEMRLTYEPKTKKFNAECKYENQTSDNISVFDNYDAWLEEEKTKLEQDKNKMKYYELDRCGVETTKFCEPELFGEWAGEFLWMNLWENRNLALPVTMSVKNKYNPGDYPLARSKLVSQKLLDVIKQLNRNYEALPTQLYYKEKDPIWDTYYSMIFPEYEVLNLEKSKYDTGPYGDSVCMIEKIVLSEEKLSHVDVANNIFALEESSVIIICTEIAKDMIEAAGIKDVSFTEVSVE